jgi:hypothetical protein
MQVNFCLAEINLCYTFLFVDDKNNIYYFLRNRGRKPQVGDKSGTFWGWGTGSHTLRYIFTSTIGLNLFSSWPLFWHSIIHFSKINSTKHQLGCWKFVASYLGYLNWSLYILGWADFRITTEATSLEHTFLNLLNPS